MHCSRKVRGFAYQLNKVKDFLLLFPGIEPCAVGSTVEVLINPHHAARPELLEVSKLKVFLEC